MNGIEGVEKNDMVKMAKLFVLGNFILGKQTKIWIEVEYIKLLDDDEQFEKYHQRCVSFNTTIKLAKKSKKNK